MSTLDPFRPPDTVAAADRFVAMFATRVAEFRDSDDEFLRWVAAVYDAALAEGGPYLAAALGAQALEAVADLREAA